MDALGSSLDAELAASTDSWDAAACEGAADAILTDRHRTDAEFFESGRHEVSRVLGHADELGLRGRGRARALDFGCGLGRLSEALAEHYKRVDGIDASKVMIEQANEREPTPNVSYTVLTQPHLGCLNGRRYDLVFSLLTLQHLVPELQRSYVEDFVRALKPTGIAIFQVPAGEQHYNPDQPHLSMYGSEPRQVERWVSGAGGEVCDKDLSAAYAGAGWESYCYSAKRRT